MGQFVAVGWVRRHPVWTLLIVLAAAFLAYKLIASKRPTYEYVAAPVEIGPVTRTISASGKIRALNTVKVGSEISGQVSRVFVDYNSRVVAGQPLAEIDSTRVRARVNQSEAQVQLANAGLLQSQSAVARARAEVNTQSREYARRSDLAARGFTSKAALEQAAYALAAARSGLQNALAGVQSARATIRERQAELQSAALDLNRTRILAPTSGTVIDKLVEPGATVAASFQTPNLFEIASDMGVMQVETSVDEADIGAVRVGQPVRFTVDSYPNEAFEATVREIRTAPAETQSVVSYLVILHVQNAERKLLPGMTANVEIITGVKPRVLRIPSAALRFRPRQSDRPNDEQARKPGAKGTAVWVATSDAYKPSRRQVRIGLRSENYIEVVGGLKQGEQVLVRSRSLAKASKKDLDDDDEESAEDEQ